MLFSAAHRISPVQSKLNLLYKWINWQVKYVFIELVSTLLVLL